MRVPAYSSVASKQSRAAPIAPKTIPNRASLRHASGADKPLAIGSIAELGSRTSSKMSSDVVEARSESLW